MVLQSLKSAGVRFLTTIASASKPTGPIPEAASQSLIRKIPIKAGRAHHRLQTRLKSQVVEGKAIGNPTSPPREEEAFKFTDALLTCGASLVVSVLLYTMAQGRLAVPLEAIRTVGANDWEGLKDTLAAFVDAENPEDSEIYSSSLNELPTEPQSAGKSGNSEVRH